MSLDEEVNKRRTFAIISHPDAGKTTITEKILYHGGVLRQTGEVKGKKGTKAALSDWMSIEKERGISVTSSVMQLEYEGLMINLLDTPGHKDFGEDTYRTLMAADSAAMLVDAAKGVEKQTRKLFEVCKMRTMPIFTFANKMDREGKDPLELIDDVESTLGIRCLPMTWPLGMGDRFRGLIHIEQNKLYLYEKGKVEPEIVDVDSWRDEKIKNYISDELYQKFLEDMELLEVALGPFNEQEFMEGKVTPLMFGSAKNNWGVDLFLELFAKYAPKPQERITNSEVVVKPTDKQFSGFVFKIQANMDKKHRDRIAFIRVCSGEFKRGMKVKHQRLNRELRLAYASNFLASKRDTVDNAFAGDIVGIIDTGNFQISDTITEGKKITFPEMPTFSPEMFAKISIKDPLKKKQLQKGVRQLCEEGAIQYFIDPIVGEQEPIVAAVGEMQFEVLLHRLNEEYNLEVKLDRMVFSVARWPINKDGTKLESALSGGTQLYNDIKGNNVVFLAQEWDIGWLEKQNPEVEFLTTSKS